MIIKNIFSYLKQINIIYLILKNLMLIHYFTLQKFNLYEKKLILKY